MRRVFSIVIVALMILSSAHAADQSNLSAPTFGADGRSSLFFGGLIFGIASIVTMDRAEKYRERSEEARTSDKARYFRTRSNRMRERGKLLGMVSTSFCVAGTFRIVLEEGRAGVVKEFRF